MKRFLLSFATIALLHFTALAQSNTGISVQEQFQKLEWILGRWNRTNVREGISASESWTRVSERLFEGIGLSMKGSDTTFVERLRIEIKDNAIFYVADVRENATPTYFKITQLTKNGFVSENPEHDFPKVISYELKEETLTAIISDGGQKKMGFIFRKN